MSDLEKLEALLPKLVHFLPDVRFRTSSSLLFKLESGILTNVLKYNSTYVQLIADSITESITLLTQGNDEWKNASSPDAQTLNTLFLCVTEMSKHESGNLDLNTNYAKLLEKLFSVQSYGIFEGNARASLNAAIEGISKIRSPNASVPAQSATVGYKENVAMSTAELEVNQQLKSNHYRGAGAILLSSLAYYGWQFPRVLLTEIDEKHLFEVEVKVKMGHEDAAELLWDSLTDFPAACILAHPGLVHAVLDVVGSTNSVNAEVPSKCLNAISAIKWLQALVEAAVKAYEVQLEGHLCSLSSNIADVSSVGEKGRPAVSLATNITQTLQNMRIPSVKLEEDATGLASVYGEPVVRSPAAMAHVTAPGVCPAPSLPGMAFAACAASLPLLQSSDSGTLAAVAALLRSALPYVKEPTPFDNTRVSEVDASISSSHVDRLRLQHLLNRMERIISMQSEPPSLQNIVRMGSYDNSEDRCTTQWLVSGASDATIFRAVLDLLALMPPSSLCSLSDTQANQNLLKMGTHTLGVVRHICMFANSLSSTVANEQSIARAWKCLERVDVSSFTALQHCQFLLGRASSLREILQNKANKSEVLMLEELHECLLDSIGLLNAQVATDYRQISDYGIIPAAIALLVRGLKVNMGGKGVPLITTLMCCDSVMCRKLVVQALSSVLSPDVIVALLTPAFLHTLILSSAFDSEDNGTSGLAAEAQQLLQQLLGAAVSQGSVRSLFISAPAKWAALLTPLKVLEWGLNVPYMHIPTAITSFVGHLEEFCARSKTGSAPHVAFDRMLALGMFHGEASVRAQCAAKVKNELERYYTSSSTFNSVPPSRLEVDPFGDSDERFLFLSSWDSLYSAQKATLPEVSVKSEDDYGTAMKLAAIAFGEQTVPIRVAAMRQLCALLCDSNVLSMAEPSWTIHLAAHASSLLGRFHSFVNVPSVAMESADARLCVEAATLLRLMVTRCEKVRNAARLLQAQDKTISGRSESVTFSMIPAVVATLQLSQPCDEGLRLLSGQIRLYCAQALSVLATSDLFVSNSASLDIQYRLQKTNQVRAAVMVPAIIRTSFRLPLSVEDLSQRKIDYVEAMAEYNIFQQTGSQLCLAKLECVSRDSAHALLANTAYLSEIMCASILPFEELHANIASVVCKAIALASTHEELRTVVSAAECLTAVVPGVSPFYGSEHLDQALERLLKTAPRTQKDMMTLSCVLQFLTALISSHKHKELTVLYDSVTTAILFPLYSMLQPQNGPKPVPSQIKEYQITMNREIVRAKLVSLIQALTSLPADVHSLHQRFSGHPISALLLDMLAQEGAPRRQSLACSIVLNLCAQHGLFRVQETTSSHVSFEFLFRTSDTNIVHSAFKTAKLLRKPDSVQGFGALLSSLKVMLYLARAALAFAQSVRQVDTLANDMNWRWLSRLFYDRHAEVRLLAIEIYSHLHNIDKNFDAALEAGNEPFPINKYLHGIAFDETECLGVRYATLRVLASSSMMEADTSLLGQVLTAVEEQLSFRSTLLSTSSISCALSVLSKTFLLTGHTTRFTECVQSLKLIPRILELLSGHLAADIEKIAFRRVGIDIVNESVTGAREWFGRDDEQAIAAGKLPRSSYNSGWERVWQRLFNGTGRMSMHLVLCAASRLLQMVQMEPLKEVFTFSLKQISLVKGITAVFGHDSFVLPPATGCDINELKQAESRSFAALADLISSMALRDGSVNFDDTQQATELISSVQAVMPRLLTFVCADVSGNAGTLNSFLRLMCAMLEHSPADTSIDSFFMMKHLLYIRNALNVTDNTALANYRARVNITISLLLQRSPSMSLSNEILQQSMANVAQGTRTLYDTTQRAMEARSAANSPSARKGAAATAVVRLELWASMLLVQSALGSVCCDREEAVQIAENTAFHTALGLLIECAEVWSQMHEYGNSTPAFSSLYAFINASTNASKSWVPSFAQLSVAGLSLCCAFSRDSLSGKRLLLTSRDISTKESAGQVWNNLYSLLVLATSRKVSPTVRNLALSLLASVMPCTYTESHSFVKKSKPSIKYAKEVTMHALDVALQQDTGKIRPEVIALLLDALGACFIAECASRDVSNHSTQGSTGLSSSVHIPSRSVDVEQEASLHATAAIANKISRENKIVTENTSMPTLMRWIWESYSHSAVVVVSLVRFIGKLSVPTVLPNETQGTFSRKLCLAVATSEEALRILTEASARANSTVSGMASLALWSIVHISEQARANVKKVATANVWASRDLSKENHNENSSEHVSRARAALQVLLE